MQRPSFRGTSGQGSPALLLPESAPVVASVSEAAPLNGTGYGDKGCQQRRGMRKANLVQ